MEISELTKIIDINSKYLGISTELLMENAGRELAKEAENFSSVAIFCGTGNNGGDGFVAARHLASFGKKVKVFAIKGERTKEAQKNFELLIKLPSIEIFEISDSSDVFKLKEKLYNCDAIIDAILGVGAKGELREPVKTLVNFINSLKIFKISADIPTPGIKADKVISFHIKKTENAKVVSIGIPKEAETFVGPGDVLYALPKRKGDEHKGDFGRILIIGGSKNFIGAPILVAKAALKAGADISIVACPKYVAEKIPYDENIIINTLNSEFFLYSDDLDLISEIDFDVAVIGNGLGLEEKTRIAVKKFLNETKKTVIVDADALKLINPREIKENMILTPHANEFKILFSEFSENFSERVKLVEKFAKKFKAIIVLKGNIDIISDGHRTKLNRTGNPGMTVGGTGDVLAGVIAALSVKADRFYAASAGAFINGLAGDIALKDFSYYFTATDVIERIPKAIKFCESFEDENSKGDQKF
ncbi:MAG: NAD(P)H-hydrate dehydratase [Candidatus Altiarchaeota archaeon]